MVRKNELPACPVAVTVSLIGSKWKLLILRDLTAKVCRFNELKRSLDGISHKMLAQSLRELEADGIVLRTVFDGKVPHVEYELTALGKSMEPILQAMAQWGEMYQKDYVLND